jgi:hypothetical protein
VHIVGSDDDERDEQAEPIGRARGAARPKSRLRGTPKGASVPGEGKAKPPRHGSLDQMPSNDESLHTVAAIWRGVAGLLSPDFQVDDRDPRIRAQADAYKDICARFRYARLLPTVVAPITLAGNGVSFGAEVWQSNPNGPIQRFVRRRFGRHPVGWETVMPEYEPVR